MSYILDALRRADAERERDPARGIHAQPAGGVPSRAASGVGAWAWPAAAFAVLAGAGLIAWQRQVPEPVPAAVAVARAPAAPVIPVAAAVMPPAPPAAVRVVNAPIAPTPAPRKLEPAPVTVGAVIKAAPPAATAAPAADRILNVAELPQDVQGQLPKLNISGGVHSDNASQRMLIVGGQVVNEGAELAPGVVLEQIRARTAVLRFRGYRYSVAY